MLETNIDTPRELGLLDVAVIIAENWLLIFVSPIVAGLLALGIMSVATPSSYDSVALLHIDATEAAMLTSARTLNPAIVGTDYLNDYQGSYSRAVQYLAQNLLSVTRQGDADLYRVSVQYDSADGAQQLLTRIVNSLIENSTPTPTDAALLAIRIEQTERALAGLELNLERTNRLAASLEGDAPASNVTAGELGETLVALLAGIEERHTRLFQLNEALRGSVSREDVIQAATLPDSPNASSAAIRAVFIGLAVALGAVVVAMIAAGWREAGRNADGLRKITRIKRALGLQPRV